MDFKDIEYLKNGNTKQQAAYKVLKEAYVIDKLKKYDPILVGTIPINIDVDNSDLDIICCYTDKYEFIATLKNEFSQEKKFTIRQNDTPNNVVCNFFIDNFEIEVFGQNTPTSQQNGYRHMLIEYKILQEKDEAFRQEIINLKKQGIKTEPAFARLLKIEGDPYIELLKYE